MISSSATLTRCVWFDSIQAAEFFQISKFDSMQLCSPLTYRDLHHLFERSKPLLLTLSLIKRLAVSFGLILPCQRDPISIVFIYQGYHIHFQELYIFLQTLASNLLTLQSRGAISQLGPLTTAQLYIQENLESPRPQCAHYVYYGHGHREVISRQLL